MKGRMLATLTPVAEPIGKGTIVNSLNLEIFIYGGSAQVKFDSALTKINDSSEFHLCPFIESKVSGRVICTCAWMNSWPRPFPIKVFVLLTRFWMLRTMCFDNVRMFCPRPRLSSFSPLWQRPHTQPNRHAKQVCWWMGELHLQSGCRCCTCANRDGISTDPEGKVKRANKRVRYWTREVITWYRWLCCIDPHCLVSILRRIAIQATANHPTTTSSSNAEEGSRIICVLNRTDILFVFLTPQCERWKGLCPLIVFIPSMETLPH